MERHLDEALDRLNTHILKMAAVTEGAIHQAVEAFKANDPAAAQAVIEVDSQIDELDNMIEEESIEILALYQPMARNLRFITTGMRINSELERIGDLTVNIAQRVVSLAGMPDQFLQPQLLIPTLGDTAQWMVKNAIDAFVRRDDQLARTVIYSDKDANRLRTEIIDHLLDDYIVKDPATARRAVMLVLVARDLERISDLAKAIAEDVIYMVEARIVKHHHERLSDHG